MTVAEAEAFGRYRLLAPCGAGGMGEVFLAVAEGPHGFSRRVIIKRLRREHSADPRFVDMLAAEARLSALLRHPNIVQVFEFDQVDGEYYLAMEYVDGWDLGVVLEVARRSRTLVPPRVVAYLGAELASALAYAHDLLGDDGHPLDIVHRDVSPSNIMITRDGGVKLLDFGIARARDRLPDERTQTGLLKGKIPYMSPEHADGRRVDWRSDLFSLGIVLHECLSGRRLFRGDSDLETLRLVREAVVAAPSAAVAGLDDELEVVVMRMLARAPADRYERTDQVAAALRAVARRLHGDAAALAAFARGLALPEQGTDDTDAVRARTRPLSPPPPSPRAWWIAALVTAAVSASFAIPRCASAAPAAVASDPAPPVAPPAPAP